MIYEVTGKLEINYECRMYCKLPYPRHPKGCPNFNNSENCPPKAPVVEKFFNIQRELFFVVEEFNLKAHIEQTKLDHPAWSEPQLKNVLYWQGSVRKTLRESTQEFIRGRDKKMIYTLLPEAMGVMVINTALKLGIQIERSPKDKIFKIALVGYPYGAAQQKDESMFNF